VSAVRPAQPVATLDEFLADPVVLDEFHVVIKRLMSGRTISFNGGMDASDMRVKVRENLDTKRGTSEPKRTAWEAEDVAALILMAWRELRP
jgi:hypothetical protein